MQKNIKKLTNVSLYVCMSVENSKMLVFFMFFLHLSLKMTGRMSYVDLAWPWGLVTLGLQPLLSPAPDQVEKVLDGICGQAASEG